MSLHWSISSRPTEIPASARLAAAITGGVALTVLGLAGAIGHPPGTLDLAVGWVVIGCGIGLWRSRPTAARSGTLMVLTGLAWLAGGVLYRGPLAHLLLAWPARDPSSTTSPVAAPRAQAPRRRSSVRASTTPATRSS